MYNSNINININIFKNNNSENIKNKKNEVTLTILEDNKKIFSQTFENLVSNENAFNNVKLKEKIKMEKNKNYKIIFNNIKNCYGMKLNDNSISVLNYLTYEKI